MDLVLKSILCKMNVISQLSMLRNDGSFIFYQKK